MPNADSRPMTQVAGLAKRILLHSEDESVRKDALVILEIATLADARRKVYIDPSKRKSKAKRHKTMK